jgi:hypothetical protein
VTRQRQSRNKVRKFAVFFATTKSAINSPRLRRIPPQLHHVLTTIKTVEIEKPPAKTPIFYPEFISAKTVESKYGN